MIKILKYVQGVLSSNAEVTALVGEDIYPNIVPDTDGSGAIKFPHIVMNRTSISPTYAKGCEGHQDEVTVEIIVWSEHYFEGIDIASAVRDALDFSRGTVNDVKVDRVRLLSADEGSDNVAYYQILTFTLK